MFVYLSLLISVTLTVFILGIAWHVKNLASTKDIYTSIPLQRYLLSKEYTNIKPGDIIYTRSSIASVQELMIPYLYKHIAIVVEFNNTLYIAETSGTGIIGRNGKKLIKRRGGVDIYPLKDRLKNIIGPAFLSKLNKPLSDDQESILQKEIRKHLGEPYPSVAELYMLFILNMSIKTNVYCHTLVYECLVQMGLINREKISAKKLGDFMINIYDHKLNNGYFYTYPKQLIYDYECNEELF